MMLLPQFSPEKEELSVNDAPTCAEGPRADSASRWILDAQGHQRLVEGLTRAGTLSFAFNLQGRLILRPRGGASVVTEAAARCLFRLAQALIVGPVGEDSSEVSSFEALPFEASATLAEGDGAPVYLLVLSSPRRSAPAQDHPLTPRQLEVCRAAIEGETVRAIAQRLALSENTVKSHLKRCYAVLGVASRVELAHRLRAAGVA